MKLTWNISFKAVEVVQHVRLLSSLSLWVFWSEAIKYPIELVLIAFVFCCSYQPIWSQDSLEVIRMKEQPIVVGRLNGKNAYFLVDTGADISILNKSDTRKYRIRTRKSISKGNVISGLFSHEREVMVAINTELYFGNKKMAACFKVMDITSIKISIGRDMGVWINGIIGTDMMKQYGFIIDYPREQIHFTYITSVSTTCL